MLRVLYIIPVGGGIPIFGYGVALMCAFVIGIIIACYRAKAKGIDKNIILDVGLYAVIAGVLGARLAYWLFDHKSAPNESWLNFFSVWQGGLTFQGGFFLSLIVAGLYLYYKKTSFLQITDIFAPSLAIGIGIGRIGCYLNGCCWGKIVPYTSKIGVIFPEDAELIQRQYDIFEKYPVEWDNMTKGLGYGVDILPPLAVYPTQLISALGLFLIAGILFVLEKKFKYFVTGQITVFFIFLYSIGRFIIEFWRDDTPIRYLITGMPGLKIGQWFSVLMFLLAIILQLYLLYKGKSKNSHGKV